MTGDRSGKVWYANYNTGEFGSCLADHGGSVESIVMCKH